MTADPLASEVIGTIDEYPRLPALTTDDPVFSVPTTENLKPELIDPFYRFVINLQSNPRVNMTVAQEVVEEVNNLIADFPEYNQHSWQRTKSVASSLDTEHKRLSQFTMDGYVKPQTRYIGQRLQSVTRDGQIHQQMVNCEIQYIPILDTLKLILKNGTIRQCILHHSKNQHQEMHSFSDGVRYNKIPVLSCGGLAVQIKLYQDDIEVANPLGANSGIYKLTMYYFNLLNIPPYYNSLLSHHHLVCVAMASDIKTFSHNSVTQLIADELKELETGIVLNGEMVYGTLVALAGDNLGLNSIIDLVESFSANHYCRFCMMHKIDCQQNYSCSVANNLSRTEEQHTRHVIEQDSRNTGVTKKCQLDSLLYFKAISSFTPDIMHDILEGVAKRELTLILDSLLSHKYFTLEDINQLIDTFNYGYVDAANKPRLLYKSQGQLALKQSASRMWCLLRSLPVMVGEMIPDDSDEWYLMRLLTEITALAFKPAHSTASTQYLDYLVEEHHILFQQLFPASPLTPKQHNLCHYGEAIRRNGPLTQYSAMRSESKHQLAKITASLTCNFINIPLTVARKYQLKSFADWALNDIHPSNSVALKGKNVVSVTVNGSTFMPGCIILANSKLTKISQFCRDEDGNPIMYGHYIESAWSPNLIAYALCDTQQAAHSVPLNTRLLAEYPHPLCIWKSPSGQACIVPKYTIHMSNNT